jgi:hypothetical protein
MPDRPELTPSRSEKLLGPARPARSRQGIGPSTRFWISRRQMRLLRSQRRYLRFRRLRNRLFRLRRRRLWFLGLLRTRVSGPHVRYVVDGIPPNSVSSFQATANGHNREKTAQEFAETSMCTSCPAPRETQARDQGIQHSHSQRLRGALPLHEHPSQDTPSSPEPHKTISCRTQATSIKSLPHLSACDAFHILGLVTEDLAGRARQKLQTKISGPRHSPS